MVFWTEYLIHRARLRGFELAIIEHIVQFSEYREVQTMKKPQMVYFEKEDILHLVVSDEEETQSIELSPNITAELNKKGELIGIEIINASTFVRDTIMEGVQAKVLHLISAAK